MLPSEVPRLTRDAPVRVFPGVWKHLSFLRLPSWDRSPSLPLLSLLLSFIFFPTFFRRQWAAFLGAWCPLPAFRSCLVEFAQLSNVLSMNLSGEKVVSLSYSSATLFSPFFIKMVELEITAGEWKSGYDRDFSPSLLFFLVWSLSSLGSRFWVRVWTSTEALEIRLLCIKPYLLVLCMKPLLFLLIYSFKCFVYILFSSFKWLELEFILVFQ